MIDLSADQCDLAIYTPALSPGCAQFPFKDPTKLKRPLPAGLALQDFDFLRAEGNSLFKMSHALYSAGHSLDHEYDPCMVMNWVPRCFRCRRVIKPIIHWLRQSSFLSATLTANLAP